MLTQEQAILGARVRSAKYGLDGTIVKWRGGPTKTVKPTVAVHFDADSIDKDRLIELEDLTAIEPEFKTGDRVIVQDPLMLLNAQRGQITQVSDARRPRRFLVEGGERGSRLGTWRVWLTSQQIKPDPTSDPEPVPAPASDEPYVTGYWCSVYEEGGIGHSWEPTIEAARAYVADYPETDRTIFAIMSDGMMGEEVPAVEPEYKTFIVTIAESIEPMTAAYFAQKYGLDSDRLIGSVEGQG